MHERPGNLPHGRCPSLRAGAIWESFRLYYSILCYAMPEAGHKAKRHKKLQKQIQGHWQTGIVQHQNRNGGHRKLHTVPAPGWLHALRTPCQLPSPSPDSPPHPVDSYSRSAGCIRQIWVKHISKERFRPICAKPGLSCHLCRQRAALALALTPRNEDSIATLLIRTPYDSALYTPLVKSNLLWLIWRFPKIKGPFGNSLFRITVCWGLFLGPVFFGHLCRDVVGLILWWSLFRLRCPPLI